MFDPAPLKESVLKQFLSEKVVGKHTRGFYTLYIFCEPPPPPPPLGKLYQA